MSTYAHRLKILDTCDNSCKLLEFDFTDIVLPSTGLMDQDGEELFVGDTVRVFREHMDRVVVIDPLHGVKLVATEHDDLRAINLVMKGTFNKKLTVIKRSLKLNRR